MSLMLRWSYANDACQRAINLLIRYKNERRRSLVTVSLTSPAQALILRSKNVPSLAKRLSLRTINDNGYPSNALSRFSRFCVANRFWGGASPRVPPLIGFAALPLA